MEESDKCHMVIVCHGFTGNMDSPLLTDLANDLAEGGIGVVRFDFNGHGKSEGEFQNMTLLNEIEDLKKVISWTFSQPSTEDISLAGYSQGGVVVSMVAGKMGYPAIKSLAIMSAAVVSRDDALRGNTQGATYDSWNVLDLIPPERQKSEHGKGICTVSPDIANLRDRTKLRRTGVYTSRNTRYDYAIHIF